MFFNFSPGRLKDVGDTAEILKTWLTSGGAPTLAKLKRFADIDSVRSSEEVQSN